MQNTTDDMTFSKNLLELSTLRDIAIVENKYSTKIIQSHGPFVQLENLNILFDLRSYQHKPLFGHNHPLFIRYRTQLEKALEPYQEKSIKFLEYFSTHDELCPDFKSKDVFSMFFFGKTYLVPKRALEDAPLNLLMNYFEVVFVQGKRLESIQNKLKENLLFPNIFLKGCHLSFTPLKELKVEDFINTGFYIDPNAFDDNKIEIDIPITITDYHLSTIIKNLKRLNEK